ncbi:hypothetical protein ABPG75_009923 [Micractinium tetrahymenae]
MPSSRQCSAAGAVLLAVVCAALTGFAAVQECARRDARIDLDPQDRGDTSRHWQLVAGPSGTLRIQSARNGCPKRYLGYSTACVAPFMGLFRLGEPGAITRFDALELELTFPAGFGPALQGAPPGTSPSVLDISLSYLDEVYVAIADALNRYPSVYRYKQSPSVQWELVGGGYASFMAVEKLWLSNAFQHGSGEPRLVFLTAPPVRQLHRRLELRRPEPRASDAIWDVPVSVATEGDTDDRVVAAIQVASGEGIAVYHVAHIPGTSPTWSAYTDSNSDRLLVPNPGRSPFVVETARYTDPDNAAAYLAITSSPSNPGCLAVRQLRDAPGGASWVAPGGDTSNPACIADLLPTNPPPGTSPIPAPVPALLASGDGRDSPDGDTDGAVRVVSTSFDTFSNAQWKQLGRARVTGPLSTATPPELTVDSNGIPYVGTLLGGGPGASVYRLVNGHWQSVARPGSLNAYSTLRLGAGFYYNSFSYPGPLRAAFDDAGSGCKTSVRRLYDPNA